MDIAVKYGFSSQESFTRAFVKAFQVIPSVYRKSPGPIPLAIRAEVFSPYHYVMKERGRMREVQVQEAEIKVEQAAWSFDPASMGYEWDEETKQDYQRHFPEGYGYAVLRPVKKRN